MIRALHAVIGVRRGLSSVSDSLWSAIVGLSLGVAVVIRTANLVPNRYDDGIQATAAWLVMLGAVPYRDFYFMYGPASPYALAGVFRICGASLSAMHAFEAALLFILGVLLYLGARALVGPRRSLICLPLLVAGVVSARNIQIPVIGALVFLFLGLHLMSQRCFKPTGRRAFASGLMIGLVTVWRLDFGLYALLGVVGVAILCLVESALRRSPMDSIASSTAFGLSPPAQRGLVAGSTAGLLLGGLLLIFVPWRTVYECLVSLPSATVGMRQLPVPPPIPNPELLFLGLDRALSHLSLWSQLYLPLLVIAVTLGSVVYRSREDERGHGPPAGALAPTAILLIACLGLASYATRRCDHPHVWPLFMAALPLFPLGFESALLSLRRASRARRMAAILTTAAMLLCSAVFITHMLVAPALRRCVSCAALPLRSPQPHQVPPRPGREVNDDESGRREAITYLRTNVRVDQPVFSALAHHDSIQVNDVEIYFAAQRRPATYWFIFDPGVTTTDTVQEEIIRDLESRQRPPVIAWVRESDASAGHKGRETGSRLLDHFLSQAYRPTAQFQQYVVLVACDRTESAEVPAALLGRDHESNHDPAEN